MSKQLEAQPLPREYRDLATAISRIPAEHRREIDYAFQRACDATRRRRRILSIVQEALAQLRLDMKYLVFDLEATRRERDSYKRQQ